MRAIISGQAGLALLGDENSVWTVSVEAPEKRTPSVWRDAVYLFADAGDIEEMLDVSVQQIIHKLEQAWRRDRALQLILILIDPEEDAETRTMAVECVEHHFVFDEIQDFVADRLYCAQLPSSIELRSVRRLSEQANAGKVVAFLDKLEADQEAIARTRLAWDGIHPDTFGGQEEKARFEALAVDSGAFRRLAEAVNADNVENFWMACLNDSRLKEVLEHRNVINTWVQPLRSQAKENRGIDESVVRPPAKHQHKEEDKWARRSNRRKEPTSHAQYMRADKEIEAIIADIDKDRKTRALRFTRELVERQKSEGDEDYAVKTLCKLASQMKIRNYHQLQLKFAQWATDEFPWDAQAQDQLGDTYLCLGRLDEALTQYDEAIERFPSNDVAYCGRGEVLRELGRLDEALAQYDAAIQRFLHSEVPLNGRGNVLRVLGRLDEALAQYDEAIARFPNNEFAYNGRGEVLRELGRLDEALAQYDTAIQRFSHKPVAYCGRAEVLRELGRLDEALAQYDEAIKRFPSDVVAYCGRGEVLRELDQLDEALAQFNETLERFPIAPFAIVAKAHVLISMKRFELALLLLPGDEPNSVQDWVAMHVRGMAHLRQGDCDTAINVFKYGIQQCPFPGQLTYFRNALAVAQLGQEQYSDAVATLGNQTSEVSDILHLHAEGKQGHKEKALAAHQRLLASQRARVILLRDELARALLSDHSTAAQTKEWNEIVLERECELVVCRVAA